jgi:uncharacterized membrane protein YhiD involved in acid resistance
MADKEKQGRVPQLWEYVIGAIALAILGVFGVIGLVVWFAINGNSTAIGLLIGLGTLVIFFLGGVMTWLTMAVNQKQDERAANQQFKITQMMMQQQQLAAGQQWTDQMKALAESFKVKQQHERSLQEQAKTQALLKPAIRESHEGEYLEIDDMDVQL